MENNFIQNLIIKCQKHPRKVALPECQDIRTFQAAKLVLSQNAVERIVFYTSKQQAKTLLSSQNINLEPYSDKIEWLTDTQPDIQEKTKQHLIGILEQKGKAIDLEKIEALAESSLYQAAYSLHISQVDTVISGAVYTTGDVIRAGIMGVGLQEGLRTVSGSFILDRQGSSLPDRTYIFGDCGVVIDPTPEQLSDIAYSCVETWNDILKEQYGDPKVAFLSFSTKGSAKHPLAEKVIQATEIFQKKYPNIISEGEFQFDAAFDKEIGQRKAPGNQVSGEANIFIFPSLDAGNIAYKITQRLGGFDAYGPILQGLRKPYSDLSRGASPEDIAGSIYINSLRSKV